MKQPANPTSNSNTVTTTLESGPTPSLLCVSSPHQLAQQRHEPHLVNALQAGRLPG